MFQVKSNTRLAPNVYRLEIHAPRIAEIRRPGQFVIVRVAEGDERIPLTIADADDQAGTITLVVQMVGEGTRRIVETPEGGAIRDVAGPLGCSTEIRKIGKVCCVGGGVGTAVLYPLAKALSLAGNEVHAIIGARSAPNVILAEELGAFCQQVETATEDGTLGEKGFVTSVLEKHLKNEDRRLDAVFAIGPVAMMAAVANQTRPFGIPTTVSLNPIMVDGTGMCGGCRVTVGDQTKFACVDGPEFDGHQVDFAELMMRQDTYHRSHECRIGSIPPSESVPSNDLRVKERMAIARVSMPEQSPEVRVRNFKEVNSGLDDAAAMLEARRCLQCKNRPCVGGCPVAIKIPEMLDAVARGDFAEAAEFLYDANVLPAITGRVCPQEKQCEIRCVRGKKGKPVAIGWIERFVADRAVADKKVPTVTDVRKTGLRMAIVGSGPGGLTAAGELKKRGHDVTVFEALHDAGGVLRYGIPEFRLPKTIVDIEVERLASMGVEMKYNMVVGRTVSLKKLREEYDAVFIANGAGLPVFLNIPGENLKGVYSSNEYLTRVNLMGAYKGPHNPTPVTRGSTVVVFGGGNTALDSVRTARRLGSRRAVLAYRRGRDEMPARLEEIVHAEEEGVGFEFLVSPQEILGDENGWVRAVKLLRMQLGEPDASGRRRPIPIEDSEFELPCDLVVVAVGTQANPLLTQSYPELKLNRWGNIEVDGTSMTSMRGVFAGGDIVRGGATVILAMGDGKRAAEAIEAYLASERSFGYSQDNMASPPQ